MRKVNREKMLDLLNHMQAIARDSDGGRQFAASIHQLMDVMREKYPNITFQNMHMLCRTLVTDKKIWCLDRGDEATDKSLRILTFGIVEPTEEPDVPKLRAVERAAILVGMLSEKIEGAEGKTGVTSIGRKMATEIRSTIMDLMCEIRK